MDSFHKSVMMRCCHLSSASLVVKHPKMGKYRNRGIRVPCVFTCVVVLVCRREDFI